MKTKLTAVLAVVIAVSTWIPAINAEESRASAVPIEAFFCNMQPGKNMKDLEQVAQTFSKWADKNFPDYSAWILTPQFGQFDELPQVMWLGSSASGDAMGNGLDAWLSTGADIQEAFDKVMTCGAHSVASSIEVNAPDGPPGSGVVMFSQCSLAEGGDLSRAVAAHKQYSQAMRGLGAKGSNWIFVPMLGGRDSSFDYWGVTTFKSWTDYFAGYELFVNGGGRQKGMEALKGAASCAQGTPTVWDVKLVRQRAS